MSFHRPINRRTMLRGVGGAVCLPLLDVMGSQSAMGAAKVEKPVRLCYLYFPNGVAHGAWKPEKVESDGTLATLNRWMKPLEPFKSDIVIPRRIWTPR